jgi:hypothetical protein
MVILRVIMNNIRAEVCSPVERDKGDEKLVTGQGQTGLEVKTARHDPELNLVSECVEYLRPATVENQTDAFECVPPLMTSLLDRSRHPAYPLPRQPRPSIVLPPELQNRAER